MARRRKVAKHFVEDRFFGDRRDRSLISEAHGQIEKFFKKGQHLDARGRHFIFQEADALTKSVKELDYQKYFEGKFTKRAQQNIKELIYRQARTSKKYYKYLVFNEKTAEINVARIFRKKDLKMGYILEKAFVMSQKTEGILKDTLTRTSVLERATGQLNHLKEKVLMNFKKHPKAYKAAAVIGGGLIAFNFARNVINRVFFGNERRAIPRYYDRGYDIIRESTTDFGSPIDTLKASRKVIAPYKSSVRKGSVTNVESVINSNPSLAMYNHAIGHTRY